MSLADRTDASPDTGDRPNGVSGRRIRAIVRRQALAQLRDPGYVFLLLALPVIDVVLFTTIGSAYGDDPAAEQILFNGILLFHLIWQLALAGSLGFLEEVWSRNVLNLLTTPLREVEYAVALFIIGLARSVIAASLIGVFGVAMYSVDPSSAGLVLIPAAIALLLIGWAVSMLVIGLTLQIGESAEVFSWATLMLLLPISGVFYPVDALPGALQGIANLVPITRAFRAIQTELGGGGPVAGDLWFAGIGAVAVVVLAWLFVLRQLRRFRQEGWVSKFT
ncbi:MAG: ABC transporter permease [Microthrixaceae bacterium]